MGLLLPMTGCDRQLIRCFAAWLVILIAVAMSLPSAVWADPPQVQEIAGRLELREHLIYELSPLKKGDNLSVFLKGASDTLDPFIAILKPGVDLTVLQRDYLPEVEKNRYYYQAKPEALAALNDKFFSKWDDRSGRGHSARFSFAVPASGDYLLLISSTPWRATFGDFRLLLGLNSPEVLIGQAKSTGHLLANATKAVWQASQRVDEINGVLTPEQQFRSVQLNRIYRGETL